MRLEMFSEEVKRFIKIALSATVLSLRELFRRIKTPSTIFVLRNTAELDPVNRSWYARGEGVLKSWDFYWKIYPLFFDKSYFL